MYGPDGVHTCDGIFIGRFTMGGKEIFCQEGQGMQFVGKGENGRGRVFIPGQERMIEMAAWRRRGRNDETLSRGRVCERGSGGADAPENELQTWAGQRAIQWGAVQWGDSVEIAADLIAFGACCPPQRPEHYTSTKRPNACPPRGGARA